MFEEHCRSNKWKPREKVVPVGKIGYLPTKTLPTLRLEFFWSKNRVSQLNQNDQSGKGVCWRGSINLNYSKINLSGCQIKNSKFQINLSHCQINNLTPSSTGIFFGATWRVITSNFWFYKKILIKSSGKWRARWVASKSDEFSEL